MFSELWWTAYRDNDFVYYYIRGDDAVIYYTIYFYPEPITTRLFVHIYVPKHIREIKSYYMRSL